MNTIVRSMLTPIIMPKNNYWLLRFRRHFVLAAVAVTISFLAYAATPPPDVRHRLSMATAYAGLIFLAASLWLGPWNVLRQRPNPDQLRSAPGCRHLDRHPRNPAYSNWLDGASPRTDVDVFFQTVSSAEAARYAIRFCEFYGLAAALLFLMLLAISNDLSLRTLKIRRWKSLQRWAYVAFVLTAAHGIAYQSIEKRRVPWVLVFSGVMIAVVAGQILGFVQVQRRISHGQENQVFDR